MNSHGHHLPSHGALMWGGGQGAPQHPLAMMHMRITGGNNGASSKDLGRVREKKKMQ